MSNLYRERLIAELKKKNVEPGVIDTAIAYANKDGMPLTDALLTLRLQRPLISSALSQAIGVTFDTDPGAPDPSALKMLEPKQARELQVVPLKHDAITNTTTVLTSSALDPEHEGRVAVATESRVYLVQVPEALIKKLLLQHYGGQARDDDSASLPTDLLPEEIARQYNVVPLREENGALVVAIPSNASPTLTEDLRIRLQRPIRTERKAAHEVANLLEGAYGPAGQREESQAASEEALDVEQAALRDNAVIKVVNDTIRYALSTDASDIHIDPQAENVIIRIRKDGVLNNYMTLPKSRERPIVARVKVLGRMNIADSLKAQDGRIRLRERDLEADMRVATQPTLHGEKVTIRLLQRGDRIPELEDLGMAEDVFEKFKGLLTTPQGMILVTGPTGSGKSSTLFSYLKRVHTSEINTLTIEDPIEYELEGVNQSQVNVKAGVTFANALRSFVRQDPDVILVGEVRDEETAKLATEAAITGHLVLSTVHTNDAPGTVTRLVEMGVEPYLLADALKAVLAQRLVRRVCQHCAQPDQPDPELLEAMKLTPQELEGAKLRRGRGCDHCLHTGFDGRLAIHELLTVTPEIESLVHRRASRGDIAKVAIRDGMRTLRQDGILKAKAGLTTLDEVLKRTAF